MNELETHVLELIGENTSSPDVFTDDSTGMAQIRDSLNDAIEEITMVTGSLRRRIHIPMYQNRNFYRIELATGAYAWPVSVLLMGRKFLLDQVDFLWLQNYNPRWMQNTGNPERYIPVGVGAICVHPAPAADGDILEVDAVVIPARYSEGTDRVNVREAWKWAAVHFAVGEYWASRGDAKEAVSHHGKYLEQLGIRRLVPQTFERPWRFQTEKREQPTAGQ